MIGAIAPNVIVGFLLIHACNLIGVIGTYLLSKYFLADVVLNTQLLRSALDRFDSQVQKYGMDSALLTMISLRVLPGSPNYVYNVILPHVERVGLGPTLISVVIG